MLRIVCYVVRKLEAELKGSFAVEVSVTLLVCEKRFGLRLCRCCGCSGLSFALCCCSRCGGFNRLCCSCCNFLRLSRSCGSRFGLGRSLCCSRRCSCGRLWCSCSSFSLRWSSRSGRCRSCCDLLPCTDSERWTLCRCWVWNWLVSTVSFRHHCFNLYPIVYLACYAVLYLESCKGKVCSVLYVRTCQVCTDYFYSAWWSNIVGYNREFASHIVCTLALLIGRHIYCYLWRVIMQVYSEACNACFIRIKARFYVYAVACLCKVLVACELYLVSAWCTSHCGNNAREHKKRCCHRQRHLVYFQFFHLIPPLQNRVFLSVFCSWLILFTIVLSLICNISL